MICEGEGHTGTHGVLDRSDAEWLPLAQFIDQLAAKLGREVSDSAGFLAHLKSCVPRLLHTLEQSGQLAEPSSSAPQQQLSLHAVILPGCPASFSVDLRPKPPQVSIHGVG